MASLEKAYLAVTQRFRDYYTDNNDYDIALRPITSMDAPIVENINKAWSDSSAKHENQYLVASLANEVITRPNRYTETEKDLNSTYQSILDESETTGELAERYLDACNKLDTSILTVPDTLAQYALTSLSAPSWTEEVIEENEFLDLTQKAEQDATFMEAFKQSFGTSDFSGEVTKVSFEKATVNIIRPWFDQQYLTSRDWRLKQDRTIGGKSTLSNSKEDFEGALPAYAIKFILIKNIKVHFKIEETENGAIPPVFNGHFLKFGNLLLNGVTRKENNSYIAKGLTANFYARRAMQFLPIINSTSNNIKFNTFFQTTATTPIHKYFQNHRPPLGASVVRPPFNIRPTYTFRPGFRPIKNLYTKVNFLVKDTNNNILKEVSIMVREQGGKDYKAYQKVTTDRYGKSSILLLKNKTYDVVIAKTTYTSLIKQINTGRRSTLSLSYVIQAIEEPVETGLDKENGIQVLGVVYKKLDKVPNPIPNFQVVELEDM